MKRGREQRQVADGDIPRGGIWSFLTETRVGSTTPLGCVIQTLLTGVAAVLAFWLVLALV